MILRPLILGLASTWLVGCQWLPESLPSPGHNPTPQVQVNAGACFSEVPSFADNACLLPDWVAFGLASQRGDRAWRSGMLLTLEGEGAEQRLGRAVLLAWGDEAQWDQASELFKADLHAAPARLQPLLRYWLNEVEGRRRLSRQLGEEQSEREALAEENKALTEKLDALTAIERNINSRQQTE
ncbi:hypothetical protein [Halomonas nitroreducens]|uniref:YfhG lipoprotein n=1 Tax=Halomonas nitroreducens TaxID=447425 RepID=A0A3S0K0C0_9GAMM|nr:hypothetical protein [Halomonas nitroreducens]RTQ98550.1 hypothetical protein EKG36_18895 [Halomonas nitroreducens]